MERETVPFACPVCGWKKEYPVHMLVEGALLDCPRCAMKLRLHGHMWKEVQEQLRKVRQGRDRPLDGAPIFDDPQRTD